MNYSKTALVNLAGQMNDNRKNKYCMRSLLMILIMLGSAQLASSQTYNVTWSEPIDVTINGNNSLTKISSSNGWVSSAVGLNILPPSTDGNVQTTHVTGSCEYMFGLSRLNNESTYTSIDFAIRISTTNPITIYEAGSNKGNFGNAAVGDVFKVSREAGVVKYYKNTTLLYTSVAASNNMNLRPDVSVFLGTSSIPPITASFDKKLVVKAQIQNPTHTNNNGSITLNATGAYAPVTYSWSSGEQSATISNKPRGVYTVTVTDAQSRSVVKTFSLGYNVGWSNLGDVAVNANNTLSKTTTSNTYDAGASSYNLLMPSTDGWIEYVINEPAASVIIGFARVDTDFSYQILNNSFQVTNFGAITILEQTSNLGDFGSLLPGDVFRISRDGTNINYLINGVIKRTVATTATVTLLTDITISSNIGSSPVITTSFAPEIRVKPTITLPNSANGNGSVVLSVQGTYPPASVLWSSGEQTTMISAKPRGVYTATVTDAAARVASRSYKLGYKPNWSDRQNVLIEPDNAVTSTAATAGWNAGVISTNILPPSTDGWVEFVVSKPGHAFFAGLAKINSAVTYDKVDYGIMVNILGDVIVYELNVNRGKIADFVEGDVYTIAREGSQIKYYRNGVVLRTIATTPTLALAADLSVYTKYSPPVTVSFPEVVQTYYSIANGNWCTPATWSLAEGGAAATTYPGDGDIVFVKGFKIDVTSGVTCSELTISANNENTCVKVDGASADVKAAQKVKIEGNNNTQVASALMVQNNGKISVQNP